MQYSLLALVILLVGGRLYLPHGVEDFVNRLLRRHPLYVGSIGDVRIHLWRGAYSIHQVRVSKTTGQVPVPLFSAERIDFAVQWKGLAHGRVVGRVLMEAPTLNFVHAANEAETQSGHGAPWLQMIGDLFPFQINQTVIHRGAVHFQTYRTPTPVDVYLSEVEATVDNLGNLQNELKPLVATVEASAMAMDQARLEFRMSLDPLSYRPSFHLAVRLLGLDVSKVNNLARAYGGFDFERGWFDFVLEMDAKEGRASGYAKPLFRNLKVFSIKNDWTDGLHAFWEALVGGATQLLRNRHRDQFGTLIPFVADLSTSTTTDLLATLGNVLRNAFVRAYLPRLEDAAFSVEMLTFGPPEYYDPISPDDSP